METLLEAVDIKAPAFDPFGVFIEEKSNNIGDPYYKLQGIRFII